jgi:PAS domain S-box-containing protein
MTTQLGLALDTLDAERAAAQLQDSLRKSVQRARAMFNRAPLGIALKDSSTGHYLEVNPKFLEIVGYSHEALLGLRWQDITHADDLAREIALTVPFFAGEIQTLQLEKRYLRPDGRAVSVHMTLAQFETSRRGNPRYLAMIEDVTERRELQQRLSQRQRLEALGQLTGGIAHDFNNLLTVILGNSEILAHELGQGDLGELAGLILTSGERAAELTQRLLTFARKQPLEPRPVAIGTLIEDLLPLLRRAVPDRIEIMLSARFSLSAVYADPGQLEMALLNLVINARDAIHSGGRIRIAAKHLQVQPGSRRYGELKPGAYVILSISDDGMGMTAETLEQAFDPFFTTKGPGQGSGLGLSLVYGFARQSEGQVEMVSRLGGGTTVRLYLPAASASPERAAAVRPTRDDRGNGETVLIAEDDPIVRKYVCAQIGGLGYRTVIAPDGRSALDALRGDVAVDLLFTDIAMSGGMDGIELAGYARDARPDLPVLFTSGHAEQHLDRLAEIEAGLLRKPYRRKDLAAHLRRALTDRGKD